MEALAVARPRQGFHPRFMLSKLAVDHLEMERVLERIGQPNYESLSSPSWDALALVDLILATNQAPTVAEVGAGIGATTLELGKKLQGRGALYIFDYTHSLNELVSDLAERGITNVRPFGSSRTLYDSYTWQLLKLAKHHRAENGIFDLAYLDGAHSFVHDVGATALLKKLMKPGGYLLFDDYTWTFENSPTMNPRSMPKVREWYSEEQLHTPHIKLICEVLMDDPSYERVSNPRVSERRALYRRLR